MSITLQERAENVITASKLNNLDGILSIFDNISVPFKNNIKKDLFSIIFSNYDFSYDEKIGFILLSENKTKRTVVSHMDLISSFDKAFEKGKSYSIEDGKLIGALDNTLTNAILINHILNNQSYDTNYLFTIDEETTQHAIRDYMKRFGREQFIINLDVTNEAMNFNMAIEYDEPSWEICKQINDNLDTPFFTTDRVCDDLDGVLKAKGFGLSYCIPSNKTIHSFNNYTMLDKIQPYMDGLEFLINNLVLDIIQPNITHLSIHKAIEFNSFRDFKSKDIYQTKTITKPTLSNKSIYKRRNPINSIKKNRLIQNKTIIESFIIEFSRYYNNNFSKALEKEFKDNHNGIIKEPHSPELTEMLYVLYGYGLLKQKGKNKFKVKYSFPETSLFKAWEVSFKNKSFDSFKLLKIFLDKGCFGYEDLVSAQKIKNVSQIDNLIRSLMSVKVLKIDKIGKFKLS